MSTPRPRFLKSPIVLITLDFFLAFFEIYSSAVQFFFLETQRNGNCYLFFWKQKRQLIFTATDLSLPYNLEKIIHIFWCSEALVSVNFVRKTIYLKMLSKQKQFCLLNLNFFVVYVEIMIFVATDCRTSGAFSICWYLQLNIELFLIIFLWLITQAKRSVFLTYAIRIFKSNDRSVFFQEARGTFNSNVWV